MSASPADVELLTRLLGRTPRADFDVVVRTETGDPVVIRNAALLIDGTPMPTRFWLVDPDVSRSVAKLESAGGVHRAEVEVDTEALDAAHAAYAAERDSTLDPTHAGPRPSGGVGGTRAGVKCLHAHYAYFLAGGDDPVGAWVDSAAVRVAAVDIGTNSVRLLVAEVAAEATVTTIERRMHITRLGQGVDASRRLAPEAVERTLAVLREYGAVIRELGAERVRATATSAARDGTNRDDFFEAGREALGAELELLPGEEEAALSFRGATRDVAEPSPYLVVDIGGGSTEFVVGTTEPTGLVSVDIGCVRITEQFLHSDPPAPEELSQAVSVVRDHLADVKRSLPGVADAATVIGLAGTVTTVAAIELGLPVYDPDRIHHFHLAREAVEDVFRTLATESVAQRRHNPGLEPARVDVIVGGTIVLASVMRAFEIKEILVSEADILDGLVLSQIS